VTDAAPTTPNEVAELWSAGAPLLYLVSVEETRAVALCHAAAQALGADVAVWSSHRGLEPLAPAARTPLAALEAVAAAARPQLAILLDFQEAFADARLVRALRDLLPRLVMGGHCLAVVAPRLALPEGLAAEVAVVRVPNRATSSRNRSSGWPEMKKPMTSFSLANRSASDHGSMSGRAMAGAAGPPASSNRVACPASCSACRRYQRALFPDHRAFSASCQFAAAWSSSCPCRSACATALS